MILKMLQESESLLVNDLIAKFSESPATIRKDLTFLEKNGLIRRTRGEAHYANPQLVLPVTSRGELNTLSKSNIARIAASMIEDDDSIILDSGTTTLAIARQIANRKKINVITNSIAIAYTLSGSELSVVMTGGILSGRNLSLIGPDAEAFFNKIEVNKLFLSASGVRGAQGLCVASPFECSIKKQMIRSAKKVIAVIDSSKFETSSINIVTDFSSIHCLITNRPIADPSILEALHQYNVETLYSDA
jgi:DeoR/GlpR family transcriptional regulator of sugar metabolism